MRVWVHGSGVGIRTGVEGRRPLRAVARGRVGIARAGAPPPWAPRPAFPRAWWGTLPLLTVEQPQSARKLLHPPCFGLHCNHLNVSRVGKTRPGLWPPQPQMPLEAVRADLTQISPLFERPATSRGLLPVKAGETKTLTQTLKPRRLTPGRGRRVQRLRTSV
jgi:hypothetical protein